MNQYLDVKEEVRQALAENKPVIALESTILSHGMPYPENLEFAHSVEKLIRSLGVIPATIAIIDGRLKVGLNEEELELMCHGDNIGKTSRRDVAVYLATKKTGATTVATTMLIAEMAAYRKSVGDDLWAYMQSLYNKFGMYQNSLLNFQFEGEDGMKKMASIMAALRENAPKEVAGLKVLKIGDCKKQTVTDLASGNAEGMGLPVSDVILLFLENDCKVVVRPSGTEPKLKAYLTANAPDADSAEKLTAEMTADVKKILGIEE